MKTFLMLASLICILAFPALCGASDLKKEDVPRLIKSLKSTDAKVRISAAEDLGKIGAIKASDAKDALPALIDVLKKDADPNVRKAAATAMGRIDPDPKEAVPALVKALKDRAAVVRIAAAGALGQMGEAAQDAVPDLQQAQKDKDRGVMRAAGMALKSIRGSMK